MRVPVLITITRAFGTTALLKSVIRPVTDALVDWPRRGTEEDRIIAIASVIPAFRDAREKDNAAMRKEHTIAKVSQLSRAHPDGVHRTAGAIGIPALSRRSVTMPFDARTDLGLIPVRRWCCGQLLFAEQACRIDAQHACHGTGDRK